MTLKENSCYPVISVDDVRYVVKIGSTNLFLDQRTEWFVVAFSCDFGGKNMPLAGPFKSKAEAERAAEPFFDEAYGQSRVSELIRAQKKRS